MKPRYKIRMKTFHVAHEPATDFGAMTGPDDVAPLLKAILRDACDADRESMIVIGLNARGHAIEPADERGPLRSRPVARVPHQAVQKSPGGVPVGRVNNQAGPLVEHEQLIVFMEDRERDLLGLHRPPGLEACHLD